MEQAINYRRDLQNASPKQSLVHAKIRKDFLLLLSAAEAYFGSWGNALHAAGVGPNLYFVHHSFRKARPKKDHGSPKVNTINPAASEDSLFIAPDQETSPRRRRSHGSNGSPDSCDSMI